MDNPTFDDLIHILDETMQTTLLVREKLQELRRRLVVSNFSDHEILGMLEDVSEIIALCGELPEHD